MKWSKPRKADGKTSFYDHVIAETPIGDIIIEWKSWKDNMDYSVQFIETSEWIGSAMTLSEAKEITENYLIDKQEKLSQYLNIYS